MSFPDIEHIRELIHRRDPHLLEKLPALLDELSWLRQVVKERYLKDSKDKIQVLYHQLEKERK